MRRYFLLCAACLALLLGGCGSVRTNAEANSAETEEAAPIPETEETAPAGDAETPPPEPLPEFSPVCETVFTETPSFPLPFEEELPVNEAGEYILSLDQALYDYDTMWLLLEENFPYFGAIQRERDIDWQAIRRAYRTILRARAGEGAITLPEFYQCLNECLGRFSQVGHLYVIPPTMYRSMLPSGGDSEDIAVQRRGELLRSDKVAKSYARLEAMAMEKDLLATTQAGATRLSAAVQTVSEGSSVVSITQEADPGVQMGYADGIPYLKCSTFADWTEETYSAVEAFLLENMDAAHFILDVRGNVGGNDPAWSRGILPYLTDGTNSCHMFLAAKSGSLNLWSDPEMAESDSSSEVYTDDTWQEDFPYIQPEFLDGADIKKISRYTVAGRSSQFGDPFQGEIWVLIDGWCYSATDLLLFFCKDTGLATLVGRDSGGNGIGKAPQIMALPYSGLLIYYEPYLSFNVDGTCNGTTGTAPDYYTADGKTALETCLDLIRGT